jgi:hypothetical protein
MDVAYEGKFIPKTREEYPGYVQYFYAGALAAKALRRYPLSDFGGDPVTAFVRVGEIKLNEIKLNKIYRIDASAAL